MKKAAIRGGGTLPEDVIEYGILPRLPAKTLIRLQCVSKRWRALISTDPHFMRLQDAHARASPALLLFGETPCPVFLSRREERDPPRSIGFPRLFRQPLFGSPLGNWLPLSACGGILCIARPSSSDRTSGLYLGNPVWMDWRPLPEPPLPGRIPNFWATKIQLAVRDTPGGTHYKLVLPFLTRSGVAGRAEAAFLVFSSTKGSWEISQQKVLVKLLHSGDLILRLEDSVCVEGIFFWLAGLEVLWFDPRDERGGAIPLPSADVGQWTWKIGEWEGKLSFMSLVGREIHMWSWNQSSWSSTTLLTMETVAEADPDFFASMGLMMNLRNRSAESLETVLNRTRPCIAAFGAGFIVFMFKPRVDVCFRGLFYDAATGKAWKLKSAMGGSESSTTPFAYANSLLKLTTP